MADPLSQSGGFEVQFNEEEKKALDDLFAVEPQQNELDQFAASPSTSLAQAKNLMQLRDDPQAIDLLGGTFDRLSKGQLPFNTQSWRDVVANVEKDQLERMPKINEAQQKGDWLGMTKLALGGVGKTLAGWVQAGFGATNEQLEKAQNSLASENYIGKIKDENKAAEALDLGNAFSDELAEGRSIAPKDMAPAMAFGTGKGVLKLGMNLARAEEYLRDLQSDKSKALGTASLRNFAVQSGDAFIPFVSIGDIVIDDETNPDLVARRGALANAINDTIHRDYGVSTLAGAAAGSVGSFIGVGYGATKALGTAGKLANASVKTPSVLSKGATYAVIGTSQSLESDPRNLDPFQRFASALSEASVLALAEGAGTKLENTIDAATANYIAAKSLSQNIPAFAPVVASSGKILGTTLGEFTSEEIEAVLRGQDPVEPLLANLGVSFGVGVGIGLPGMAASIATRKARIYQMAENQFQSALEQTLKGVKTDPNLSEEQKQIEIDKLRGSLTAPKALALFDALNVRAAIDPNLSPESHKVATKAVDDARQGSVEQMLQRKIEEAEGRLPQPVQIGQPPVMEAGAPESEEQINQAFGELVNAFQQGAENITLQSTPQNQAKIDWLEKQGRVYGELTEDGTAYVIRGVKDAEGNWLGTEDPMELLQDEKDAIIQEIQAKTTLTEEETDDLVDQLERATNLTEIENLASRVLGPSEIQVALETRLAQQQERVAEEKPAEFRAQKIQGQIEALQKKIVQSPVEEQPALEQQLANLQQLLQQEQTGRLTRGEQTVADLVRQYEREADAEERAGKVSPIVLERPEVVLAMNNPENATYQKFLKLEPDPRENNPDALPSVFNLSNPATVELLQSLGAIDENGRNILSPAETLVKYVQRKNEYLRSRSLSGYQGLNISDEVSAATTNKFLYELRQGKSNLSLSTIFNSQLRNFIEAARPRLRAGVGVGAARQLEEGRTGAMAEETLAEDLGLNPAIAGAVNETLGQLDATDLEVQAERQTDIPSPAQRQEALAVIAQNMQAEFRNSLKTDAEKLAFDSLFTGKKNTAQEAKAIGTTIDDINALQPTVREKFVAELEKRYRRAEEIGALPERAVEVAPEAVREGTLSPDQIQPAISKFRRLTDQDYFDEEERTQAQNLLSRVQTSRQASALKAFDDYVNNIVITKLDPDSIEELAMQVAANLENAQEDGKISKAEAAKYRDQLTKLEEQYLKSEELEDVAEQYKVAGQYRSNLLRANDQLMRDAGYTINERGFYEDTREEAAKPAQPESTIDRRAAARERLAQVQAERAASAKGVPQQAVQPVRKEVGRPAERAPAGGGRPGVARPRGTPIEKSFVKPRSQIGKPYAERTINSLGKEVLENLDAEQRQDVAAAIASMQGSSTEAFYLANGPGTGKTRVLLATAKYYLDRKYNVFYLTAPDAVTPDWRRGVIGGSLQKDAELMGIPLTARGSTAEGGLPIKKIPGQVVATTYTSSYIEQVLEKVDKNTVVIFDEQHAGRNLHKAIQEGRDKAWSILMDKIAAKAGKVLMASGTPFETPAQLLSLGRLGIFNNESPDALFKRLGFERKYLPGGKKSYWDLVEGVTEEQMQERLEEYLDSLSALGIIRSRSLKLDGVNIEFQDVPLNAEITKKLEDLTDMYGGFQNSNIAARRKLVAAHKRALEEHKVEAAAKRAVDAIRRGRKPILYVGFVSEETARGDIVDPTSALVEAEIKRLQPGIKIARMYTGSDQTKEQAMAAFNEGDADVLIATKEMGGTGIELDDKFGDEAREMIVLAPPVSAIQAVQLVYRVWRVDSASRPTVVFLESTAQVDQMTLDRMRAKLLLLDATMGAGFEGLKAEGVAEPTKVIVEEPTEADIAEVEKDIASYFGRDYANGVVTLRDASGTSRSYNVSFSNTINNLAHAEIGSENETDTVVFNPEKISNAKQKLGQNFKSYFTKVLIEESIHVETFRYFRDLGLNPVEELTAIGEGMSQAARLATARLYHSGLGADITNTEVQGKIKALASDPYMVATEAVRQLSQLNLTGGITEQVVGVDPAVIARANARLRDVLGSEPKPTLARLGVWFDSMVSAVKKGLGLAPSAVDRLAMRQGIEDAVGRLRKTSTYFINASKPAEAGAPAPATEVSPTRMRPATSFDSYDLRVYRMIENHLEGRVEGVLGVTAVDNQVSAEDWLDALNIAARRGIITRAERNLYRAATKASLNNGQANLYKVMNESLRIAELMEEAGQSLPVEALIPTTSFFQPSAIPAEAAAPQPEAEHLPYRVKIGNYPAIRTTAPSSAKAVSNAVFRLFDNQEVIPFNGKNYSRGGAGALIAAMRDFGYDRLARPLIPPTVTPEVLSPITPAVTLTAEPVAITPPSPVGAPEIRESRAVKNIATQFIDSLPDGSIKDKVLDAWYYQPVSRDQQFEDARAYISTYGVDSALQDFLSGNLKTTLPLQAAIGFELAKNLSSKAKGDKLAQEQLAEVMLIVSKKYGTDPGRTVDLWNALGEISDNPEAMKMYINKQIDEAVKGRLTGLANEEAEVKTGLVDASRRAADAIATSPKTQKTLNQLAKLIELNKRKAGLEEFERALADYLGSDEATAVGAEFLGADLGAGAPEPGASDADNIRLDPNQTKALGTLISQIIQRSENPRVTAASPDEIKRMIMLVPSIRDAKNQDNVRRKVDLYFDAALSFALESFTSQALRAARARAGQAQEEVVAPPATRGEARKRSVKAQRQAKDEAPVIVPTDTVSRLAALAEASADALQRQAERLQEEPKKKDALEEFATRIRRLIAQRTKEMGGLQPTFQPEPQPSEAEVLRDRIARYPEVQEFIDNVRDSLKNNYKEEELAGLEPFIDEAFGRPFTVSNLKRAVRTLESIGGPQTNLRALIRSSRGDIMDFENKMGAALTQSTTLNEAEKKEVLDFLREGITELIAQERKAELQRIKDKFERQAEKKTRKVRSALDKLIEAVNLGVLTDDQVFMNMRSQLGLPELKDSERDRLNKLIEDLPLYPKGMIRNKKISEMYQYVKLVSPQAWGDLIVNYQTSNLLAGIGTIGINAWSAAFTNLANSIIIGARGLWSLDPKKRRAYLKAFGATAKSIFTGEKPAWKAAKNVLFTGDYSNVQDALTMELGGVNLWEAILAQAEAYRAGKAGATKPELPVKVLGQEYRIPLDSRAISSKYGLMAPFIWFGRAMAAGDAFNKISSRKMYEMAEAYNIAASKGLQSQEEIELEVNRLLNLTPEARRRAEARAEAEATEFGLTPDQQALRVEELLEQGRPEESDAQGLIEKAKVYAAQATFTNDFEGWFGLVADRLTSLSMAAWPFRLFIKFLRTGSSLANETLNFMPGLSIARLYFGTGVGLTGKYRKAAPMPGTVEHDLLLGKIVAGHALVAFLGLELLKAFQDDEDDPRFMIHFKGPIDPAQREAFFAAKGKLRAMQFGKFKDGNPRFVSFESLPVGLSGPLILVATIAESLRYEKRATAETVIAALASGGVLAAYGVLDMAALSGIRQIMSLTSSAPGPGGISPESILNNMVKTVGNLAAGLIPGYASLRDFEQVYNSITGAPSTRPFKDNLLSTFLQSVPFASKVKRPDLNFLGGNVKTGVANSAPFLRRITTTGVDSNAYDTGDRSEQAIHDKLVSLFASNRTSIDWEAGPLKDFAMPELVQQAAANGESLTYDDFFELRRELTADEKYEWLQRAGPAIQQQLAPLIPQLEQAGRAEFITYVRAVANPVKRAILYQILLEKNQEGILLKKQQ